MVELKGILSRQRGLVRVDQPLPHEAEQSAADRSVRRRKVPYGAVPELLADDRCAFEDITLIRAEPVEARGQQRLDRWRHLRRITARTGYRCHLLDEKRVAPCCRSDPRLQFIRDRAAKD